VADHRRYNNEEVEHSEDGELSAAEDRIKQRQREVLQMRKRNQKKEQDKLAKFQKEYEEIEARKVHEKEHALRLRREELEMKRMARLQRANQRKKMLEDLKEDDTALRYRQEQLERKKRRDEEYVKNYEMPELEKRKKALQELRRQFQPMDHDNLKNREKRYLQMMNADVEAGREQKRIDLELNEITAGRHYQGKYLEKVSHEMKEKRAQQQKAKADKQDRLQRRRRYAELVSEMFPPSVDEHKKQELQQRIHKLQHPVEIPKRVEQTERNADSHPPVGHRRKPRRKSDARSVVQYDEWAEENGKQQQQQRKRPERKVARSLSPVHEPRSLSPAHEARMASPHPPSSSHSRQAPNSQGRPQEYAGRALDDALSVGAPPSARLSEWGPVEAEVDAPGEEHTHAYADLPQMATPRAAVGTPRAAGTPRPASGLVASSAFADISPPAVRLSAGAAVMSQHITDTEETMPGNHSPQLDLGNASAELRALENNLERQAEESNDVMAAIRSKLDAMETT